MHHTPTPMLSPAGHIFARLTRVTNCDELPDCWLASVVGWGSTEVVEAPLAAQAWSRLEKRHGPLEPHDDATRHALERP